MGEPAVKRVLAAMVMADVVGYSRLMAADESGTVSRLRHYRSACIDPTIRLYDARIVDAVGDSIFFVFSSVVDATRCAITLQQLIADRNSTLPEERRLLFRMGINIGDVITRDRALFGDGVNLAARLQSLAEPGGICLSKAAFDHVRPRVEGEFLPLGPRTVKNMATPIDVFSLSASAIAGMERPVASAARKILTRQSVVVAALGASACLAGLAIAYGWGSIAKTALKHRLDAVLAANDVNANNHPRTSPVERYLAIGPHRAFAIAPHAQNYWWTGEWPSLVIAEEKAIERCQLRFGEPCALVASDESISAPGDGSSPVTHDMPRLHYTGDFDPAQIPGIRLLVAQRPDVVGYANSPQPKAAAINPHGTMTIVTGASTQRRAEIQALRSCNDQAARDGEGDCILYASGNRVVLPLQPTAAASKP